MTKKPAIKKPSTSTRQIIHESDERNRHRLVVIGEGLHDRSAWYEFHQVGVFRGYHFSTGAVENIPSGVFKTATVEAQVLL